MNPGKSNGFSPDTPRPSVGDFEDFKDIVSKIWNVMLIEKLEEFVQCENVTVEYMETCVTRLYEFTKLQVTVDLDQVYNVVKMALDRDNYTVAKWIVKKWPPTEKETQFLLQCDFSPETLALFLEDVDEKKKWLEEDETKVPEKTTTHEKTEEPTLVELFLTVYHDVTRGDWMIKKEEVQRNYHSFMSHIIGRTKNLALLQYFLVEYPPDFEEIEFLWHRWYSQAILTGNTELAKWLLRKWSPVNLSMHSKDESEYIVRSLLQTAINFKNLEMFYWMVDEWNVTADTVHNNEKYQLLRVAVESGNLELVKWMVKKWPPTKEHFEYCDSLLLLKAEASVATYLENYLQELEQLERSEVEKQFRELFEQMYGENAPWPPAIRGKHKYHEMMMRAIGTKNLEVVKYFVKIQPPTYHEIEFGRYGWLYYAVTHTKNLKFVQWFYLNFPLKTEEAHRNNYYLLFEAIETENLELVQWMVEMWPPTHEEVHHDNYCMLQYAIFAGNLSLMEWMMEMWPPTKDQVNVFLSFGMSIDIKNYLQSWVDAQYSKTEELDDDDNNTPAVSPASSEPEPEPEPEPSVDVPHGVHEEYYENGELKRAKHYINGKKTGIWKSWFSSEYNPSGTRSRQLMSEKKYTDGKLDGTYKKWWPTGRIRVRGTYKMGRKTGLWEEFYLSGKKKVVSNWK